MADDKPIWLTRKIVVYSDSPDSLKPLRDLIRSFGWSLADIKPTLAEALAMIRQGQASIVIADESPNSPFFLTQRQMIADEIGCLTPLMGIVTAQKKMDKDLLMRIGSPDIIERPFSPATFIPGFSNVLRKWETKLFTAIRASQMRLMRGQRSQGLGMLQKLTEYPPVQNLAQIALAIDMMQTGKPMECERFLLSAINRSPGNITLFILLGQLYLNYASPRLALNLFTKAQMAFKQTPILLPDIIQAHIMLNNFDSAIGLMQDLVGQDYMRTTLVGFLARTLMAAGMTDKLSILLGDRIDIIQSIRKSWIHAENFQAKDQPIMVS